MNLYTKINNKNGLIVKKQTIKPLYKSIKIFLNLDTKFSSLRHFGSL